jgi:hypothetical protein
VTNLVVVEEALKGIKKSDYTLSVEMKWSEANLATLSNMTNADPNPRKPMTALVRLPPHDTIGRHGTWGECTGRTLA